MEVDVVAALESETRVVEPVEPLVLEAVTAATLSVTLTLRRGHQRVWGRRKKGRREGRTRWSTCRRRS